jgi:hypothetical protein
MLAHEPNSQPIAPTESIRQPDGSISEITDIPIVPAELGVTHSRVLRKPQLSGLSREKAEA